MSGPQHAAAVSDRVRLIKIGGEPTLQKGDTGKYAPLDWLSLYLESIAGKRGWQVKQHTSLKSYLDEVPKLMTKGQLPALFDILQLDGDLDVEAVKTLFVGQAKALEEKGIRPLDYRMGLIQTKSNSHVITEVDDAGCKEGHPDYAFSIDMQKLDITGVGERNEEMVGDRIQTEREKFDNAARGDNGADARADVSGDIKEDTRYDTGHDVEGDAEKDVGDNAGDDAKKITGDDTEEETEDDTEEDAEAHTSN